MGLLSQLQGQDSLNHFDLPTLPTTDDISSTINSTLLTLPTLPSFQRTSTAASESATTFTSSLNGYLPSLPSLPSIKHLPGLDYFRLKPKVRGPKPVNYDTNGFKFPNLSRYFLRSSAISVPERAPDKVIEDVSLSDHDVPKEAIIEATSMLTTSETKDSETLSAGSAAASDSVTLADSNSKISDATTDNSKKSSSFFSLAEVGIFHEKYKIIINSTIVASSGLMLYFVGKKLFGTPDEDELLSRELARELVADTTDEVIHGSPRLKEDKYYETLSPSRRLARDLADKDKKKGLVTVVHSPKGSAVTGTTVATTTGTTTYMSYNTQGRNNRNGDSSGSTSEYSDDNYTKTKGNHSHYHMNLSRVKKIKKEGKFNTNGGNDKTQSMESETYKIGDSDSGVGESHLYHNPERYDQPIMSTMFYGDGTNGKKGSTSSTASCLEGNDGATVTNTNEAFEADDPLVNTERSTFTLSEVTEPTGSSGSSSGGINGNRGAKQHKDGGHFATGPYPNSNTSSHTSEAVYIDSKESYPLANGVKISKRVGVSVGAAKNPSKDVYTAPGVNLITDENGSVTVISGGVPEEKNQNDTGIIGTTTSTNLASNFLDVPANYNISQNVNQLEGDFDANHSEPLDPFQFHPMEVGPVTESWSKEADILYLQSLTDSKETPMSENTSKDSKEQSSTANVSSIDSKDNQILIENNHNATAMESISIPSYTLSSKQTGSENDNRSSNPSSKDAADVVVVDSKDTEDSIENLKLNLKEGDHNAIEGSHRIVDQDVDHDLSIGDLSADYTPEDVNLIQSVANDCNLSNQECDGIDGSRSQYFQSFRIDTATDRDSKSSKDSALVSEKSLSKESTFSIGAGEGNNVEISLVQGSKDSLIQQEVEEEEEKEDVSELEDKSINKSIKEITGSSGKKEEDSVMQEDDLDRHYDEGESVLTE